MEISVGLRERFCKDCNIPIYIFQEPYFTERMRLYDAFYGGLKKWELFLEELGKYRCEQDYFEEYNRVKDAAISSIKNSEAYQQFNEEDMNQYQVTHTNLPGKSIFKPVNDGRTFISIDMKKANFSALRHYDPAIFGHAATWEDFLGIYTNNRHMIGSKYIRQVILGNCNPKRHITYEKYLMDLVLIRLEEIQIPLEQVVFFSNDEIVIDMSDRELGIAAQIDMEMKNMQVPLRTELFTLHRIEGTDGYCKAIYGENERKRYEFKCLDNYRLPFVLRYFLGEDVTDSDKVFYHEGLLAQFLDIPKISVVLC